MALRKSEKSQYLPDSRNLLEAIYENEAVHIKCQKIRATMLGKKKGGSLLQTCVLAEIVPRK